MYRRKTGVYMTMTGISPTIIDPKTVTPPPKSPEAISAEENAGLFEGGKTPGFDDFEFEGYKEYKFDSALYNHHMQRYQAMKQSYGTDMSFSNYMESTNVGRDSILQQFENFIETGETMFGDRTDKNRLNKQRMVTNPQDQNEEVYWNADKTEYYMINWNEGTYKAIDPAEVPFLPPVQDPDPEPPTSEDIPTDGNITPPEPPKTDGNTFLDWIKEFDPIGYNDKDGNRLDFVIDRNNDGIFNGPEEFLGASNNWQEMADLDKDGNGIVEGSELAGLKMVKTGANGVQSFIDAVAMNLKIYLDSYFKNDKEDKKIGEGQKLLGNFNISADGETYRGYNTLDSLDYLNKEYGNIFNKEMS